MIPTEESWGKIGNGIHHNKHALFNVVNTSDLKLVIQYRNIAIVSQQASQPRVLLSSVWLLSRNRHVPSLERGYRTHSKLVLRPEAPPHPGYATPHLRKRIVGTIYCASKDPYLFSTRWPTQNSTHSILLPPSSESCPPSPPFPFQI